MIGKLRGVIDSYGEDFVILDVGGVGYQVHCSTRTLQSLPSPGAAALLSIDTYVREDMLKLYGFAGELEREWFRLLQTVQGVGAKVALAILGVIKPADLGTAIALQDKGELLRAPGVGKKLAERIVIELRDKAPAYSNADPAIVHLQADLAERRAPQPIADAVSALVNLGYAQLQASAAVAAASRSAGTGAEAATLIRLGLKEDWRDERGARLMQWRPLGAAISYGILGPIVGAAALALIFAPAAMTNSVSVEGSLAAEFMFRAYIVGGPPMIATGFLAALASKKRRLPSLTLLSAILGFILTGVSFLLLMALVPAENNASFEIALWGASAGAFGGFGAALLTALIMTLRKPLAN